MEAFKQASRLKLRFNTDKGLLSAEQLWDLNFTQLGNLVKAIKKVLAKSTDDDELSFLLDDKVVDVENQLRFDIVKDVYLTKKKDAEDSRLQLAKKENNQKILALIAEKQEDSLKSLSVEQLKEMLQ